MGTKGREIIGVDVDKLVEMLNRALADEWNAYYQYWVSAKVVKGPMKDAAITEFLEHAADELRHADMLVARIQQLGGEPITNPEDWEKTANCKYIDPTDPFVKEVLRQGVEGERCAIDVYSQILDMVRDKDVVTYEMAAQILADEVDHEEDFQALLEDIEQMQKH